MAAPTVLVGSFSHETNTFSSEPTGREAFQRRREAFGEAVPAELEGTNTAVGGAVAAAREEGIDLVHTVAASATPGGYVTEDAYEYYTGVILDGARDHAGDVDGVLLCLHGAMVPEGREDGEGPLIAAVREAVEDAPVVVTLDPHGNVTDRMVEAADALVAYETYPHVDMAGTGRRGMALLARAIRREVEPTMAVERPPVLAFGPRQNTRDGPMAELMGLAREREERADVLKVNVMPGFQGADIPAMGASVSAVTDGDPDLAAEVAREVGVAFWERREEFVGEYPTPPEAVERAIDLVEAGRTAEGPVVLADVGDNPGGGGAADGTVLLRELLAWGVPEASAPEAGVPEVGTSEAGAPDAGLAILRDPEVVEVCVRAGVGETVTVTLGGKTDDRHGDPIEDLTGYVKAVTDGKYVNTGPMATGTSNDLGRTVRFECGPDRAVTVVVTERRLQPLDAEVWRHVGVPPERLDALVVKSMNHFRADYEPMASEVIPVNSPGLSTMDPRRYDHERIRRPQFPIDEVSGDEYPE